MTSSRPRVTPCMPFSLSLMWPRASSCVFVTSAIRSLHGFEVGFQGPDEFDTEGVEVLPMTTLSLDHLAAIRPEVLITLQF